MSLHSSVSRRGLLRTVAGAAATGSAFALTAGQHSFGEVPIASGLPLQLFEYGAVQFSKGLQEQQLQEVHAVLMDLDENRLLKPYRRREGFRLREMRWAGGMTLMLLLQATLMGNGPRRSLAITR